MECTNNTFDKEPEWSAVNILAQSRRMKIIVFTLLFTTLGPVAWGKRETIY